jgi:DNA-binding transcriptional LysR family regulator
MNVRISEYLLAIQETGSLSRAAAHIHISQSALSQSLQREETEIGTALFYREHNSIKPTEAGQVYLKAAARMVALRDDAYHRIRRLQSKEKGILRIVLCNQTYALFAKLILDQLTKDFPGFEISLSKADSEEAYQYLLRDIADVAVLADTEKETGLIMSKDLYQDKLVLAIPENILWDRTRTTIENLKTCPMILPEKSTYLYQLLPEEVKHIKTSAKIFRTNDVDEIATLVINHYGVAFLPGRLVPDASDLTVQDIIPERNICIKTAALAFSVKKSILEKAQDCICSCFAGLR